eukprot:c186_g1_i1 orf=11-166(-)
MLYVGLYIREINKAFILIRKNILFGHIPLPFVEGVATIYTIAHSIYLRGVV